MKKTVSAVNGELGCQDDWERKGRHKVTRILILQEQKKREEKSSFRTMRRQVDVGRSRVAKRKSEIVWEPPRWKFEENHGKKKGNLLWSPPHLRPEET